MSILCYKKSFNASAVLLCVLFLDLIHFMTIATVWRFSDICAGLVFFSSQAVGWKNLLG